MVRSDFIQDIVQEVHNIARERGMDTWLETEIISIVREAFKRVEEEEARRDQDRHVRPGPQLGSGRP